MITNLRKILGLSTIEEQINEYESIQEQISEQNRNLDEVVSEHYTTTNLFKSHIDGLDDNIQKGVVGSTLLMEKVRKRYEKYFDSYIDDISKIKKNIDKLNEKVDQLLSKNPALEKAIHEQEIMKAYEAVKLGYKNGKVERSIYEQAIISTEDLIEKGSIGNIKKTKYADCIIRNNENKILFLKRDANNDFEADKYGFPGGHLDAGEDFKTAAIRECEEETGLKVTEADHVFTFEDDNCIIQYFECEIEKNNPFQDYDIFLHGNEHSNYRWLSYQEYSQEPLIMNLQQILEELYGDEIYKNELRKSLSVLIDSYKAGKIEKSLLIKAVEKFNDIEKAHKYIRKEFKNGKWEYIYKEGQEPKGKVEEKKEDKVFWNNLPGNNYIKYYKGKIYVNNRSAIYNISDAFKHYENFLKHDQQKLFYRATNNENEHEIKDLKSKNHLSGDSEKGMSVYYNDTYKQKTSGVQEYDGKKYIGIVSGDIVGFGSDGEPLLDNVKWIQNPISKLPKKFSRDNVEKKRELTEHDTPWKKLSFSPFDNDIVIIDNENDIQKSEKNYKLLLERLEARRTDKQYTKEQAEYVDNWSTQTTQCEFCEYWAKNNACNKVIGEIQSEGHCKFFDHHEIEKSLDVIQKAFEQGLISEDILEKAKQHKYLRKEVDNKGKTNYIYKEKQSKEKSSIFDIDKIKQYAEEVIKGEKQIERLSPEEEQGRIRGGQRNVEATLVIGTSEDSNDEVYERGKELNKLKQYAQKAGCWIDDYKEYFGEDNKFSEATESEVFYDNKGYVIKINNFSQHEIIAELFDRIAVQNILFPDTNYELLGFTERDGEVNVIMKQPFVIMKTDETGEIIRPSKQALSDDMSKMGFEDMGGNMFINSDYIVEDLHSKNVCYSQKGQIMYIDPVIRVNIEDEGYGGDRKLGKIDMRNDIQKSLGILEKALQQNLITEDTFQKAVSKYGVAQHVEQVQVKGKDGQTFTRQQKVGGGKEAQGRESGGNKDYSDEELTNYAKETPEDKLKTIISNSSNPKLREAAHKEMERRKGEEHVGEDKKENNESKQKPESKEPKPESKKESGSEENKYSTFTGNTEATVEHHKADLPKVKDELEGLISKKSSTISDKTLDILATLGAITTPRQMLDLQRDEVFQKKILKDLDLAVGGSDKQSNKDQVDIKDVEVDIPEKGGNVTVKHKGKDVGFDDLKLVVDGKEAFIPKVKKKEGEQKGIGTATYIKIGQELHKKGIKLTSSDALYADGMKMWQRLAKQGYAKKVGNSFEFVNKD